MKRRIFLAVCLLACMVALTGCNTVRGMCADIYGAASGAHAAGSPTPEQINMFTDRR
jgi:predicted small secreted protein